MFRDLTPEQVQDVFKRDLVEIMGFDLFSLPLLIEYMNTDPSLHVLDNHLYEEIRNIVRENIEQAIDEYFTGRPNNFKHPVDHYKWIMTEETNIRKLFAKNLDVAFDDEPLKYHQNMVFQLKLDKLFEHLLTVGETHQFDREIIESRIEENEEDEEED